MPEPSLFLDSVHTFRWQQRVFCLSFGVANRSTELDLPYPDLQEYIADMNVMMALIINGPVYVSSFLNTYCKSVYAFQI